MNIMFFLTPKDDTVYAEEHTPLAEVVKRMDDHGLTAIPIIDRHGKYLGTVREGDILRLLTSESDSCFREVKMRPVSEIPRRRVHRCLKADETVEAAVTLSASQNFIPIADDQGIYIGLIKRGDIIEYLHQLTINKSERAL